MSNEYLTGHLTVHYGCDVVQLVHRVNGRFSFMDLVNGDHIEVEVDDKREIVSVSDVLNDIVDNKKSRNDGRSFYHDANARVKLDLTKNAAINNAERRYKIQEVLTSLKYGAITQQEAESLLVNLNTEDLL